MFTKIRTNEKGFTLIELLIVVAIIGILAAIAIPQFSQYRIRGYNSAANSDIRNIKIAEEAFVTDWQVYVSTAGCAPLAITTPNTCTGVAGAGLVSLGPGTNAFTVAAGTITTPAGFPAAAANITFGLSSGVTTVINTTAATGANYVSATSHTQGNTIYGADSDNTQIKQAGKSSVDGTVVLLSAAARGAGFAAPAGVAPASVATADDLLAASGWANL